ncbi:hypothetical protein UlMin_015195 [Ulmus minor]
MGGHNNRQKKSSSLFSIFMFRRSRREDAMEYEASSTRRVWPSDEDKVRWVADPAINRKADDFIAKIHRNIATDSERQTFTIPQQLQRS